MSQVPSAWRSAVACVAVLSYSACLLEPEPVTSPPTIGTRSQAVSMGAPPPPSLVGGGHDPISELLRQKDAAWASRVLLDTDHFGRPQSESRVYDDNLVRAGRVLVGRNPAFSGMTMSIWATKVKQEEARAIKYAIDGGYAFAGMLAKIPGLGDVVKGILTDELTKRLEANAQLPIKERIELWFQFYKDNQLKTDLDLRTTRLRSAVVDRMLQEAAELDPNMSQDQRDKLQFYLIGELNKSIAELTDKALSTDQILERLRQRTVTKDQMVRFSGELDKAFAELRQDIEDVRAGTADPVQTRALAEKLGQLDSELASLTQGIADSFEEVNSKIVDLSDRVAAAPNDEASRKLAQQELYKAVVSGANNVQQFADAGSAIGMMLSPFEPELAVRITTIADNAGKIANAAVKLTEAYQQGMMVAGMMATGGMIVAGAALMSAFGGGGLGGSSGPDPATMAALAQISEQIANLDRMVRIEFGKVHDELAEIGVDVELLKLELSALRDEMRDNFAAVRTGQAMIFESTRKVLERVANIEQAQHEAYTDLLTSPYRHARLTVLRRALDSSAPFTADEMFKAPNGLALAMDGFMFTDLPAYTRKVSRSDELSVYADSATQPWAGGLASMEEGPFALENALLPASSYAHPGIENGVRLIGSTVRQLVPATGLEPTLLVPPTWWKDASATLLHLFVTQPQALSFVRKQGRISVVRQGKELLELAHALQVRREPYDALKDGYEQARVLLARALENGIQDEKSAAITRIARFSRDALAQSLLGVSDQASELANTIADAWSRGNLRYLAQSSDVGIRDRLVGPITASADDQALLVRASQLGVAGIFGRFLIRDGVELGYVLRPVEPGRVPDVIEDPGYDEVWKTTHRVVDLSVELRIGSAKSGLGQTRFAVYPGVPFSPRYPAPTDQSVVQGLRALGVDAWPADAAINRTLPDGKPDRMRVLVADAEAGFPTRAGLNSVAITLNAEQRAALRKAIDEAEAKLLPSLVDAVGLEAAIGATKSYGFDARAAERSMTVALRKLATYLAFAYPSSSGRDTESAFARIILFERGLAEGPRYRNTWLEARRANREVADTHAWSSVQGELDDVLLTSAEREARLQRFESKVGMADLNAQIARLREESDARLVLEATRYLWRVQLMRAAGFELDEELATYVELWASFVGAASVYDEPARLRALCMLDESSHGGRCAQLEPTTWLSMFDAKVSPDVPEVTKVARVASYPEQGTTVARYAWVVPEGAGLSNASAVLRAVLALDGVRTPLASTGGQRVVLEGLINKTSPDAEALQSLELTFDRGSSSARHLVGTTRWLVSGPDNTHAQWNGWFDAQGSEDDTALRQSTFVVPASETGVIDVRPCAATIAWCGDRKGYLVELELNLRFAGQAASVPELPSYTQAYVAARFGSQIDALEPVTLPELGDDGLLLPSPVRPISCAARLRLGLPCTPVTLPSLPPQPVDPWIPSDPVLPTLPPGYIDPVEPGDAPPPRMCLTPNRPCTFLR